MRAEPHLNIERLLDFVLPPLCVACLKYSEAETGLCESCQEGVERFEYPFCLACLTAVEVGAVCPNCGENVLLYALGDYAGALRETIIQFKFRGFSRPIPYLATQLSQKFGEQIRVLQPDYLMPVPLHSGRLFTRGFNQAEVIARQLSDQLDIPIDTISICRVKRRPPQAKLHLNDRVHNIEGAYQVTDDVIPGSRVLLVDDVITSGATVREVQRTLEAAGVCVLGAMSLAHGL